MKWKTRLAQLVCMHSELVEISKLRIIKTVQNRALSFYPISSIITTYECQKCGKLVDK